MSLIKFPLGTDLEKEHGVHFTQYRKRPVVIGAIITRDPVDIETLEGWIHASPGDYIIKGIAGELYPCKPGIFEKTYEQVEEA